MAFNSDGNLLAFAGYGDKVRVWQLATWASPRMLAGNRHIGWVGAVAFSPVLQFGSVTWANRDQATDLAVSHTATISHDMRAALTARNV